jgi:hypothetical protein
MNLGSGTPLVFNSDDGSPLVPEQMRQCCHPHRVEDPLSSPLTLQYSGVIEATGGPLKTRAAQLAMQSGGCDTLSIDILEASRLAASAIDRPLGATGLTPDERWQDRVPLTPEQWSALRLLVAQKTADITQLIQHYRIGKALDHRMTTNDRATFARIATRRDFVELGHLHIRRPTRTMSTRSHDCSSEDQTSSTFSCTASPKRSARVGL